MQLFKRVLLSLFPSDFQKQHINPVSLFISFVSPKQFFSVINRKIVENYKLNLFDIALDSFEVKIGFGDKPAIGMKQLEQYYGYAAAANLNGYRFLNPGTIGLSISMFFAHNCHSAFHEYPVNYFRHLLVTSMHLHYIFAAHFKSFPPGTREQQYDWFVEVFFNYYDHVLRQNAVAIEDDAIASLRHDLIQESQSLLLLFESLQKISEYMHVEAKNLHSYFQRFFFDSHGDTSQTQRLVQQYMSHCETYVYSQHFNKIEQKLLPLIVPVDMLLKYIFHDDHGFAICENLLSEIFGGDELQGLLEKVISSPEAINDIIVAVTDSSIWKQNFLTGIKKFVQRFRLENKDKINDDDIEDFMSSIGTHDEITDPELLPESLRKESAIMENFMNFYITHLGGLWVARGDNGYVRICNRPLLDDMYTSFLEGLNNDSSALQHYHQLLKLYNKNAFYYSQAYDNIRAGKDRFHLPFKASVKKSHSHIFLIPHFVEHFCATLLQDMTAKDTRIYITQKGLIADFKHRWSEQIQELLTQTDDVIGHHLFGGISSLVPSLYPVQDQLTGHINQQQWSWIKDRLYTIDYWIFAERSRNFPSQDQSRKKVHPSIQLSIVAMSKESLFGLLLVLQGLLNKHPKIGKGLAQSLLAIYTGQILHLSGNVQKLYTASIRRALEDYQTILTQWLAIDENQLFITIGIQSRRKFSKQRKSVTLLGEDLVWLSSYIKTIQYYNIRYVIPR